MRIRVDYALCCGNGLCVSIAPGYLSLDQRGHLSVMDVPVMDDDVDSIERAVSTCPVAALRLER
ncbi:MAG: ferredoxin [Pseudonocardiaceae bacterium]